MKNEKGSDFVNLRDDNYLYNIEDIIIKVSKMLSKEEDDDGDEEQS